MLLDTAHACTRCSVCVATCFVALEHTREYSAHACALVTASVVHLAHVGAYEMTHTLEVQHMSRREFSGLQLGAGSIS